MLSDWTLCHNQQKWQNFFCSQEALFIQIGRANTGKNALDHALFEAARAMTEKDRKCFIAVTSDKDFAKLAKDLHRNADTCVIGIGCNKNDAMLKEAYDEFYQYGPSSKTVKSTLKAAIPLDASVSERLRGLFRQLSDGEKWVPIGEFGNILKKKDTTYKFPPCYPAKLKKIFELHRAQFEMKQIDTVFYVRERNDALLPNAAPLPEVAPTMEACEAPENFSETEMRLRWKIAVLMLHEDIDLAAIGRITNLSGDEIQSLGRLLKQIKG